MMQETEQKIEQEQRPLTIPVAVLRRKGEVFVVREKNPEKYTTNEWRYLTGRPHRGEEGPEDLPGLVKECGFRITGTKTLGSIDGDGNHSYFAQGPVRFDLYLCPVVAGDFAPELIHPNKDSIQNQYSRCEGKWFKKRELKKEKYLH